MPAPTNTSAATATVISGIPYMILLSADDVQSSPGTDHPLWWKFTNTSNTLISINALGTLNGVTYPVGHTFNVPNIELFTGTPGSLTEYPPIGSLAGPIDTQSAIQAGFLTRPITFYIKVTVDGGGFSSEPVVDPLSLNVLPGRNITAPRGSWIVLSDHANGGGNYWPGVVFGADGTLKQSVPFVAGEQGYVFDDGTFAILDETTSPEDLKIYAPDSSLLFTVPISGGGGSLSGDAVSGDGTSTIYVAKSSVSVAAVITAVDKTTGASGSTWTLPANSKFTRAIAVSRDGSILYYSVANAAADVHRYDLIADAPLSDFVADNGYDIPTQGIFVLKDDTIVIGYFNGFGDSKIIRYNAAGTVLNTYVLPSDLLLNLFSPYSDDPDSLLVWMFNQEVTVSHFYRVEIATGDIAALGDTIPVFEDGEWLGDQSNTPPHFGVPFSCPLLVLRVPLVVPDTPPPPTTNAPLPCCDALSPGQTASNPGPVVPPVSTAWTAVCRGGGAVPTAADIVNSEDWAA